MPLKGIPKSISPELLFAIARMGHGDQLILADSNFPSDSVAQSCVVNTPIRVIGNTDEILCDLLTLFPLDQYTEYSAQMMDRVESDKAKDLQVEAYASTANAVAPFSQLPVQFVERFAFYERAKKSFVVVQTSDARLYANIIISKGVI
jgi:L-fucose mutarotase